MNITATNNLQGIQAFDRLAGILKTDSTAPADATVGINGDGITISVNDGSGATRTIKVSVPDLGKMDGVVDSAALQNMADKIVALANELAASETVANDSESVKELEAAIAKLKESAANPSSGTTNTSKALFDLFALMALMVEVSQKQRDTSREIRLVENQQVQNSIKQQADNMRSAALISLGFGIASAVVSGVMSGVSLGMQAKAFSQQSSAVKTMDTPAQNLKTAQLASDPQAAQANLEAVSAKTPQNIRNAVDQKFSADRLDFETDIQAADVRLNQANAAQDTAGAELVAAKAKTNPPATPEEIKLATDKYDSASKAVASAKDNRASLEKTFFDKLDTNIRANDAAIASKQDQIATKQADLKSANGDAATALRNEINTLKNDVQSLKQENAYLRAYTAKQKADFASETTRNSDLVAAQNKYDFAKREMELSDKFAGSQQMMNRWMGIQQLSMSLSQMTNASGNMIGEMIRAKATMEGVEQEQHREQLDQIKDLFSQAETVVQAVVQLMQAVLSAENESLMEAIRA